jgi:hypothetical protein
MLDDYAAAERSLSEAVGLSRELGHRLGEARALHVLGEVPRLAGTIRPSRWPSSSVPARPKPLRSRPSWTPSLAWWFGDEHATVAP